MCIRDRIRTPDRVCTLYSLSRRAPSATRSALRLQWKMLPHNDLHVSNTCNNNESPNKNHGYIIWTRKTPVMHPCIKKLGKNKIVCNSYLTRQADKSIILIAMRRYLSWIEGLTTNQNVIGSNPIRRTI